LGANVKRVLVLLVSVLLAFPAFALRTDAATLPIPPLPTDLLDEPFSGAPVAAAPLPHQTPPQNPTLAPDGRNSMHNDAYASDAYEVSGPLGRDLEVRTASYGVSECATVAFDSRDRIVGLCGGLEGFALRLIDPDDLHQIATLTTGTRDLLALQNPFTDLCGGTYFYLDPDDNAFVLTPDKEIWKVHVGETGFEHTGTYELADAVPGDDCVIATLPDWHGNVFFATEQGRVGVIDPATGAVRTMQFAGERIVNSMAGDETDAIYVLTDHRLAAVEADASGAPVVRWATSYDRGTRQKPGMLSQGSGTTPTLIGDDLVAIADNAEPRMHVQFYQRSGPRAGRLICQAPVFGSGTSATENSLVAGDGNSVMVENNYDYEGVNTTTLGRTSSPGIAKVVLRPNHTCDVAWTSAVTAPTSVPKVSWGNGLLYVYAKPASNPLDDSWYFTAIDVRTGRTAWQQKTGNGIQWNNHYASVYLGPDGAAYMPVLSGLIRLADRG
jgi:hypothetical protein